MVRLVVPDNVAVLGRHAANAQGCPAQVAHRRLFCYSGSWNCAICPWRAKLSGSQQARRSRFGQFRNWGTPCSATWDQLCRHDRGI